MAMMETLTIGDKVSLSKVNENALPEVVNKIYASKLLEIKSDKSIVVTMPIYKNRIINLEQDGDYIVTFFTKNEIFRAKGKIVQKYLEKNIRVAEIYLLSDLIHFQRRNFYRLSCIIEAMYRALTPMEELIQERISMQPNQSDEISKILRQSLNQLQNYNLTATISDLSGGGIRFHSDNKHNVDDRFKFNFVLSGGRRELFIELNVKIIDVACIHVKPIKYEYRAIFDDVSSETREKIVRYVFDVQRAKRRRDKGID